MLYEVITVANIVAIEGKPKGNLEEKVLHDENDNSKSYSVKGGRWLIGIV